MGLRGGSQHEFELHVCSVARATADSARRHPDGRTAVPDVEWIADDVDEMMSMGV